MSDDHRLTLLEERYVHLQRHVAEQDKVMLELTEELARLRAEVAVLRAQRQSASGDDEPPDERPPHY